MQSRAERARRCNASEGMLPGVALVKSSKSRSVGHRLEGQPSVLERWLNSRRLQQRAFLGLQSVRLEASARLCAPKYWSLHSMPRQTGGCKCLALRLYCRRNTTLPNVPHSQSNAMWGAEVLANQVSTCGWCRLNTCLPAPQWQLGRSHEGASVQAPAQRAPGSDCPFRTAGGILICGVARSRRGRLSFHPSVGGHIFAVLKLADAAGERASARLVRRTRRAAAFLALACFGWLARLPLLSERQPLFPSPPLCSVLFDASRTQLSSQPRSIKLRTSAAWCHRRVQQVASRAPSGVSAVDAPALQVWSFASRGDGQPRGGSQPRHAQCRAAPLPRRQCGAGVAARAVRRRGAGPVAVLFRATRTRRGGVSAGAGSLGICLARTLAGGHRRVRCALFVGDRRVAQRHRLSARHGRRPLVAPQLWAAGQALARHDG
eukprot:352235-Chlamydomonas_euryale.AAC.3